MAAGTRPAFRATEDALAKRDLRQGLARGDRQASRHIGPGIGMNAFRWFGTAGFRPGRGL